eukprot:c11464_g2_i1 orf=261-494(+)
MMNILQGESRTIWEGKLQISCTNLSPTIESVDVGYSALVEDGEEMLNHQSECLPASSLLPLFLSRTHRYTQRKTQSR